ncbi:MAG: hypothetical protein WA294_17795 [Acidobacteriaceae bacterium]
MIDACLDLLFGCIHRHQSRPFTLNKHCYTVCLDCGHETPYSWREMRPMTRADQRREASASELETAAAA